MEAQFGMTAEELYILKITDGVVFLDKINAFNNVSAKIHAVITKQGDRTWVHATNVALN